MKQKITNEFKNIYGYNPIKCFSCGGRFEILGNHTDHNNGLCLAATCDLSIYAATSKREDYLINFVSKGFPKFSINLEKLQKVDNEIGTSQAIVRGVAKYLSDSGFKIGGFDVYIESLIPSGSGVSSSAAFELLICEIFNSLFNDTKIDKIALCRAGQFAEREYYGKMCGLLDQIGVAYGGCSYIDFKDISKPYVEPIKFENDDYKFLIVNSGGSHAGLDNLYKEIPDNMHYVAKLFHKKVLRDVALSDVISKSDSINERQFNRALHFYSECERVSQAKSALVNNEIDMLIMLMNKSRQSSTEYLKNMMINDKIEGSPLEACLLIDEASHNKAGVKINGGGFAGTVIAIVPNAEYQNVYNICVQKYGKENVHNVSIRNDGPKEI